MAGTIRPDEGINQFLDPNHSLFILVDTKKAQSKTDDPFSGELQWRLQFERFLAAGNCERKVPIVSLLVNGGLTAIRECAERLNILLEQQHELVVPLVVIKGSGRAANLIAELHESPESERWVANLLCIDWLHMITIL